MSALAEVSRPADQSTDDLDLVAAVRAGDDRAFELLFARYQGRVTAYVRGMVRDDGRAEDITQDVFIAALRRMRETEREIAFKPWIYEIAKNACIDAFRRSRATREVSFDADGGLGPADQGRLADAASAPDAVIDSKLAIDNLCGAIGGLSPTHRDILVMREFEGLSYREIGDRLGMSGPAVESTLFRARRRLGEEYDELVSGERCARVRTIVDAPADRAAGLRDRRRLARHISHCQPCRRYALRAGVDVAALRAPAVARIAALLPLPAFVRRRVSADDAGQALGAHSPALNVVATLDPSTVSGWSKAVVTAATVAVAGLGAGAAVKHDAIVDFISRAPAMVGLSDDRSSANAPAASRGLLRLAAVASAAGVAGVVADERAGRTTRDSDGAGSSPGSGASARKDTDATGSGSPPPDASSGAPGDGGADDPIGGVLPPSATSDLGAALGSATEDPATPRRSGPVRRLLQSLGGGASTGAPVPDASGGSGASTGDAVGGVVTGLGGTGSTGTGTVGSAGAAFGTGSVGGDLPGTTSVDTGAAAVPPDLGGALATIVGQALGTSAGST